MGLITIEEYDMRSNSETIGQPSSHRILGFDVHSDLIAGMLSSKTEERIGAVAQGLVDEAGQIQYIVIELGANGSGRQVLLPADQIRVDYDRRRVYAASMTREQAEFLPEYDPRTHGGRTID